MESSRDDSGRRRAIRHETLLSVTLKVAEAGPHHDGRAVVSSLSRSGLFCSTPARAAVGQTVLFEFTAPNGTRCEAVGNIIEDRGERGFAVEFQGETVEMKAFFDEIENAPPGEGWSILQGIDDGVIEII